MGVPPYFGSLAMAKKLMGTLAQILLGFLVFPILAMLVELFLPGQLGNFITNCVSGIELFEVWPDAISTMAQYSPDTMMQSYTEVLVLACGVAAMETGIISLCIMLCKNIGIVIHIKGAPVLQTLIGVFLGCIFCKSLSITDELELAVVYTFLFACNCLIVWIYELQPVKTFVKTLISASLSLIIAGMTAAYVTTAMMMIQGQITDLLVGCKLLLLTFIPLVILLIIDYFFFSADK